MFRIIPGIFSIMSGITAILYGILPHYYVLAYDRSVMAGVPHVSGPISIPEIYAIPPINYLLVVLGSALIALGIYLILTGIFRRQRPFAKNSRSD